MLKTLKNILKTGDATVKYPFAPLQTTPDMRGKPEHDAEKCIACGACAVACPPNAIQMHTDLKAGTIEWSIDYGRCIFCARCEEVCPLKAIKLGSKFELAVMSKADLSETCTYTLEKCSVCGKYFAPHKEVDYAARLLAQSAAGAEAHDAGKAVGVCPDCKRARDAMAAAKTAGPAPAMGAASDSAAGTPMVGTPEAVHELGSGAQAQAAASEVWSAAYQDARSAETQRKEER